MTKSITAYGWFRRPWLKRFHFRDGSHTLCGMVGWEGDTVIEQHLLDHPANCRNCRYEIKRRIRRGKL